MAWRSAAACVLASSALAQAPATAPAADLPSAPQPSAATLATIASYKTSLPAGVAVEQASGTALPLSITDAIKSAEAHNLSVRVARANQLRINGLQSTVLNALTPGLSISAYSSAQELNLAAMGFKPQSLGPVLAQFGISPAAFQTIVKVNVTNAQVNLNQQIFNLPAYFLYKASRGAGTVARYQVNHARGSVVYQAGSQYLRILADASQIANARSQIASDQLAFDQARARQQQGVGIHLDTLRAQVQLQNEQQALTSAEVTYEKDKIQLNRVMGVAVDQQFIYTDLHPFADLEQSSIPELLERAYGNRNDLLGLEAQQEVLSKTERAARYDRLPTLAMKGFYGVIGETTGLYHGNFNVQGQLTFPIFEEAQFRGEREVSRSELLTVSHQINSLKGTIAQQIRDSLLDLETNRQLVKVATSNVQLAREELADSDDRFKAGVDDTLPVVQAQSSLAAAETNLVQANFQLNIAKLQLSYYLGGIENDVSRLLGSQP